jgi:uncharacterized protein (TIGR03067 family)
MRLAIMLTILGTSLSWAADAKEDAAKDKEKLQGTWLVVGGEERGEKIADADLKMADMRFIIEGDKIRATVGDKDKGKGGTFKLDPSKKPKEIDLIDDKETVKGIYSLDGDTLKLCLAKGGNDRPSDFTTKKGDGRGLFVLKRDKK